MPLTYWRRSWYWILRGPRGYWTGERWDRREEQARRFFDKETLAGWAARWHPEASPMRKVTLRKVTITTPARKES